MLQRCGRWEEKLQADIRRLLLRQLCQWRCKRSYKAVVGLDGESSIQRREMQVLSRPEQKPGFVRQCVNTAPQFECPRSRNQLASRPDKDRITYRIADSAQSCSWRLC